VYTVEVPSWAIKHAIVIYSHFNTDM